MKTHNRPANYETPRVDTLLPRKIAECARKKGSQTWNLVIKGVRLPRVVILFICASIPLCFRQYNVDPYRHSRHLSLVNEDSSYYHDPLENQAPVVDRTINGRLVRPIENSEVHPIPTEEQHFAIQLKESKKKADREMPFETNHVASEKSRSAKSSAKQLKPAVAVPLPIKTKQVESEPFRVSSSSAKQLKAATATKGRQKKPSAAKRTEKKPVHNKEKEKKTLSVQTSITQKKPVDDHSMRACIFVRNDNHLLAEWIAYHYTVLPLRHLIVGVDENASDDPNDILMRWKGTGLKYEIWHPQNYTKGLTYKYENPLHRFRQRQPHFMAKCLQHFHKTGNRGWLALVDTDEYIKLNPLDDALNEKFYKQKKPLDKNLIRETQRFMAGNETLWDRVAMRKSLRQRLGLESNSKSKTNQAARGTIPTILDVLEEYSSKHGHLPCHPMARRRYSAVMDNYTALSEKLCTPKLNSNVTAALNVSRLSTVRFLYHAKPEYWLHNEWAKTLIDLRRLPLKSLDKVKNPHQPLKECQGLYVNDLASFIHTNHYINDFSVFAGRKGDTRDRNDTLWKKMGLLREGVRCDQIHGWLNDLVHKFGVEQAKHLLARSLK